MIAPYYVDDSVTLYHGDCMDVLPQLSGVDMVFTSPPYNLGDMSGGLANLGTGRRGRGGGQYRSYADTRAATEYEEWQKEVLAACWATLSDTGAIFYNHKPIIRAGAATLPTQYNPGLPLRQIVIWYRQMGVNWAPSHFLPVHEWILILAKEDWKLSDKSASHASDVWAIRPDMEAREHPAPFPLALPSTAINATAARVVMDPFAGSGTTLLAARNLGRKAIGIEMDERYCEIAVKRLEQQAFDFGDWEDAS